MELDEIGGRNGCGRRQCAQTNMKLISFFILSSLWIAVCISMPASAGIPFNETIPGDRNIGQNFTWTAYNVSMKADAVYHYTVYDYRDLGDEYHYWSVNWGQWMVQTAQPKKKYFVIWIRGWLEGTAWHGWGSDRFRLWIGNKSFTAEPVQLQDIAIRNIGKPDQEITTAVTCPLNTQAPVTVISSSGTTSKAGDSGRYLPVVIQELEYQMSRTERGRLTTERYGWKDENEMIRMEPGISNAYDGLMIFQVPDGARPESMVVSGSFWSWGPAFWHLTNTTISQDSAERSHLLESVLTEMERDNGLRLPDKEPDRVMG
jgi:hypothetical protein